jgi:hypothetical protein
MNVFDEERGPLAEQTDAERIAVLAASGVTLQEFQAYSRYLMMGGVEWLM